MSRVSYEKSSDSFAITGLRVTDDQPVRFPVELLYPGCCCFGPRQGGGWDMHDNEDCGNPDLEYFCCFDVDDAEIIEKAKGLLGIDEVAA